MNRFRQRVASLISSVLFLGFLWILFKKMIVVTWISMPWWALILLLIVLFFFIETMVARTVGAKGRLERSKDAITAGPSGVPGGPGGPGGPGEPGGPAGHETLDSVKAKLDTFDRNRSNPPS